MDPLYPDEDVRPEPNEEAYRRCEELAAATGAVISHHAWEFGGVDYGFYNTETDEISLLEKSAWGKGLHFYYSTMFHELIHWTSAAGRLKRDQSGEKGDPLYAMEELIAEYGAKRMATEFGILVPRPSRNASVDAYWRLFPDEAVAFDNMTKEVARAVEFLYSFVPTIRP